ncbi:MAG TPA: sugar transferase [Candidatus Baltobacteraceae bacterium]|jgi:lipopolysaccharide/colanic/teichoic acid biosynthesis glycosyltransferase|nr:sugar transferase [Candidatus Baltobacteraceae bacterium]
MTTDTQAIPVGQADRARQGVTHLPERLSCRMRTVLPASDILVIFLLCLLAFSSASNGVGAALVTVTFIGLISWNGRQYERSFAVYARDEAYYACASVLLAALPALVILTTVGNVPIQLTFLALALSALGSSVVRVRLHLQRRGNGTVHAGIESVTPRGWASRESAPDRFAKGAFHMTLAALLLIVLSPVMLLIAIAILIESGRPVLFRQERVGREGAPFVIFKFRTMRNDAGSDWVRPGDTRITRLGAFLRRSSLDELPQLLNVLAGKMSIVGPRPEMVEFASSFSTMLPAYSQRTIVLPGITGWAQLYYKRNLTPEDVREVLPYDLFYVEYTSVVMDCALIIKTICEVLFHRAV